MVKENKTQINLELLNKSMQILSRIIYCQAWNDYYSKKNTANLNNQERKILVSCNGESSLREIAKNTSISEGTVPGIIERLIQKGLITSIGKGRTKRYISLEGVGVNLVKM